MKEGTPRLRPSAGGYHDWESARPQALEEKVFVCNYAQYIETFVYFSHKLVCIPPAAWINAMHRNGVKVLGTFMIEGDDSGVERILDQEDGGFVVAKRLAQMASAYGFDGWMLNIEAEFPGHCQHPTRTLATFLRGLKRLLGAEGLLVWYDALTKDNEVDYQNSLNAENLEFALAADAFFTNYKWTVSDLEESKETAEAHGIKPAEIHFGIDVWAQNTNMPGPPRITFPRDGGGGTLTGVVSPRQLMSQIPESDDARGCPRISPTRSVCSHFCTRMAV